ncbi:anti-virulence regulator CigR family protein [Pseudomonas fluorescens]|uniref:anti-virulence regulator CigR family protein n=1 Tax=Pseudomonas fluorescens TaxID=294 RepID=UPI001BE63376|nr:anti-virulence regulator CigR family protein [Pseudomonas fluorescens]MBT2371450.1 RcnB family protein [Pseudomonas fluorescens]
MKMPKRLIVGAGVLMLGASALVQAAPPDQRGGPDHGGPQGQYEQRGDDHRGPQDNHRGGPPQDFGPVRQVIRDNHNDFRRGAPPPPGVRLVRGQPLPRNYYGERLDNRALARLPQYPGYEWRRSGGDVVLIAIGTSIVYQILDGALY